MNFFRPILFLFHHFTLWYFRSLSPIANLVRTPSLLRANQQHQGQNFHTQRHPLQNNTGIVPIKLRGLNYSPRQGPDSWGIKKCKTLDRIRSEFRMLTQLTDKFHLYALAECSQARNIIPLAKEMGFQLFLNMWVNGLPIDDPSGSFAVEVEELNSLLDDGMIDSNTILAISVGSESYHRHETTIDDNIAHFNLVKNKIQRHPETMDIPLTVTDVDKTYIEHPELLSAVDFASVNAFPFFDPAYGRKDASKAVDYLTGDLLAPLLNECAKNGKPLFLTETGWPAAGTECSNSGIPCAEASMDNQLQYFVDFYCKVHLGMPDLQYFWFTGIDPSWRRLAEVGENSVEGHFGIFDDHGNLEHMYRHLLFQCPGHDGVTFVMPEMVQ